MSWVSRPVWPGELSDADRVGLVGLVAGARWGSRALSPTGTGSRPCAVQVTSGSGVRLQATVRVGREVGLLAVRGAGGRTSRWIVGVGLKVPVGVVDVGGSGSGRNLDACGTGPADHHGALGWGGRQAAQRPAVGGEQVKLIPRRRRVGHWSDRWSGDRARLGRCRVGRDGRGAPAAEHAKGYDGESGPVHPVRPHSTDGSAAGVWSVAPIAAAGSARPEPLLQRRRPRAGQQRSGQSCG